MSYLIIFLVLAPHTAFAWGAIGHRVVGQIAQENLKPKIQIKVQKLLGRDNMADASLWADIAKSNPQRKFQSPWHHTNIKDHQGYKNNKRKDIVWAIGYMVDILQNKKSHPQINQTQALKLLIHFVGDLHQPLHAGRRIDQGGHKLKVYFFTRSQLSNLHTVWDTQIIERFKMSYTELTSYIQRQHHKEPVLQLSPKDWANQSAKLLRYVYFFDNIYYTDEPPLISHQDILKKYPDILNTRISKKKRPYIHFQYLNRNLPIVFKRLYEAGMRLAHLLNEILQ